MLSVVVFVQNLRWLVPTAVMIGIAPAYFSIWSAWRLVSAFLPQWVYVKGDDFMFSSYHRNLLFYFELLTGVELIFYGDLDAIEELCNGENCIYMSNHQSTMDWVLASSLAIRRGCLGRVRYVLKDGLKFLPYYGVYLGLHGSLFVKRAGKFRKDLAKKQLQRDAQDKKPMWLVIFPEGTRYNPELMNVIENSKKFAKDRGLQQLEAVLFPRAQALQVCVEHLEKNLDCIYDVTIAYGSTFSYKNRQRLTAPSMQDFLLGYCQRVHIHVSRIPMSKVPRETDELKKWLYERFQIKDRLMQDFYSYNSEAEARFPGVSTLSTLSLSAIMPSVFLWSGSFLLISSYQASRDFYWKLGIVTAAAGLALASIKY